MRRQGEAARVATLTVLHETLTLLQTTLNTTGSTDLFDSQRTAIGRAIGVLDDPAEDETAATRTVDEGHSRRDAGGHSSAP
jgi:hypothetical protein